MKQIKDWFGNGSLLLVGADLDIYRLVAFQVGVSIIVKLKLVMKCLCFNSEKGRSKRKYR